MGKTVSKYLSELQTNLKEIHDVAATHALQEQKMWIIITREQRRNILM